MKKCNYYFFIDDLTDQLLKSCMKYGYVNINEMLIPHVHMALERMYYISYKIWHIIYNNVPSLNFYSN